MKKGGRAPFNNLAPPAASGIVYISSMAVYAATSREGKTTVITGLGME